MSARFNDTVNYENGESGTLTNNLGSSSEHSGRPMDLNEQKHRLSFASKKLDRGNKGYLDDIELCARKYDVDGDGQFSIEEVTRIVQDLESQRRKKHVVKRKMFGILGISFVLLLCVFGLMMSTLILSRKVNVNESTDELVSDKTGHTLMTMNKGLRVYADTDSDSEGGGDGRALDEESRVLALVDDVGTVNAKSFTTSYDVWVNSATSEPLQVQNSDGTAIYLYNAGRQSILTSDDTADNTYTDVTRYTGLRAEASADTFSNFYRFECSSTEKPKKCMIREDQPPIPIIGGVTNEEAVVGFQIAHKSTVHVRYSVNTDSSSFTDSSSVTVTEDTDFTGSIKIGGLASETTYYYQIVVDGWAVPANNFWDQTFRTFPEPNGPNTFIMSVFADAANANTDRVTPAYSSATSMTSASDHYLSLQIGDFDHDVFDMTDSNTMLSELRKKHYGLRNPVKTHGIQFVEDVLAKRPLAHLWDDHDFCGNDSDGTCDYKAAALQAYKEYYPGYDLPYPDEGIWHSFTAGAAEIFMLDTRYQRTPDTATDDANKSVLGSTQKQWLKDGLKNSAATWKIVVSTINANVDARPSNIDHWGSFTTEANEMKEFLIDNDLDDSTVMISGDLHTGGAVDSGCNNRWGIAELGTPHTNLASGNDNQIGTWSEGVTYGTTDAEYATGKGPGGYSLVKITPDSLTLEANDANGDTRHSIVINSSFNKGCETFAPTASPAPSKAGFTECTDNVATFRGNSDKGSCMNTNKGDTLNPPFYDENGSLLTSTVTMYKCADKRILTSNAIPDHTITIGNRNTLCEHNYHFELPLTSSVALGGPQETSNWLGIAYNGVPLFHALETGSSNAAEPENANSVSSDEWWGHPTTNDIWHYHAPYIGHDPDSDMPGPDDFLGWAMDGFEIYGPVDDEDLNTLDECNFNGTVYHVRANSQVDETADYCNGDSPGVNWNYILGCFVGDLSETTTTADKTIPDDCVVVETNIF